MTNFLKTMMKHSIEYFFSMTNQFLISKGNVLLFFTRHFEMESYKRFIFRIIAFKCISFAFLILQIINVRILLARLIVLYGLLYAIQTFGAFSIERLLHNLGLITALCYYRKLYYIQFDLNFMITYYIASAVTCTRIVAN